MKNPWLSLWLSAANSAAGAARGFWTAHFRRQHKAMANETGRSMSKAGAVSKKRAVSKRRKKGGH